MAKRSHPDVAHEINEEAKKMAVTWQLKAITDRAAREFRRPVRPPPKCRFCQEQHNTSECRKVQQQEKLKMASKKKICQICLTNAGHVPASCRLLRVPHLLCQRRNCNNKSKIHHVSICEIATPPNSPPGSPAPHQDIGEEELLAPVQP